MKPAFNTFMFPDVPAADLLKNLAGAGYTGVGLYSGHFNDLCREQPIFRNLAMIGKYVLFLPQGTRADSVRKISAELDGCEACGVQSLTVIPAADWRGVKDHHKLLADIFDRAIGAHRGDCALCIEPLHPDMNGVSALTGVADLVRLYDHMNTDGLRWILDTSHIRHDSLNDRSDALFRRLQSVHIGDAIYTDEGKLMPSSNTSQMLQLLKEKGYDGWLEFETLSIAHHLSSDQQGLRKTFDFMQRLSAAAI